MADLLDGLQKAGSRLDQPTHPEEARAVLKSKLRTDWKKGYTWDRKKMPLEDAIKLLDHLEVDIPCHQAEVVSH